MKTPVIAVTMGDPCGVGPEIVALALKAKKVWQVCMPVVVGQKEVFQEALRITNSKIRMIDFQHLDSDDYSRIISSNLKAEVVKVPFVNVGEINIERFEFGVPSKTCGRLSFDFIGKAVQMCKRSLADGIATAPINKTTLRLAGIDYIGHTEILQDLTGSKEAVTMFQVKKLKIFFLSRHTSLEDALKLVKREKIAETLIICDRYLRQLKIKTPHIAVAALNPHAGEKGLFGREEVEEIKPGIEEARSEGVDAEGPFPADSIFHRAAKGEFDAVLSLYHDQGHIASKMYDFEKTISVTFGLPFIRTSVDHGTAYDIAGKGICSETSMI
jgi:4-hydroxythreonine-4-phosphate dehydrogenase